MWRRRRCSSASSASSLEAMTLTARWDTTTLGWSRSTTTTLMMLGLQVQSVMLAEYFPHKGDSSVYIELSGNGVKRYLSLSSSRNPAK
jgi:hypothetical protein